jgi:NhaP-type Na+/H+ or K+/H+ antiporter
LDAAPALIALAFVAFALVSRRIERTFLTGAMLFVALGLVMGPEILDTVNIGDPGGLQELLLEATLVIVLFTDASAVNSSHWREEAALPGRLLGIGLPLMILGGWTLALALLGGLEFWEAAILATMLAPTDAALGKSVVSNPRVPERIRQALNVESGLNDGIALPVFVVFLEAAQTAEKALEFGDFLGELIPEVGVAVIVGVAVGAGGARSIDWATGRRWAVKYWLEIAVVALALLAFAVADPLGGSGFIAAWVAGATYGRVERSRPGDVHEFAEATGDALTMGSLLLFGIALGPILTRVGWDGVLYAVLSLAVVRLAAVAVSLLGSGLALPSILYLGWFGPRGLATLILTIAVVEGTDLAGASTIAEVALVTVALSVVAHGATSGWGSNAYADWVESQAGDTSLPESRTVQPVRVPRRSRPGTHGQGKH